MSFYKFDKKGKIYIDTEALQLCPVLKKASSELLEYAICAYAYSSPFSMFPPEEMIRKAKKRVYGKSDYEFKEPAFVQKIVDSIRSLQFDERRETINAYRNKVGILRNQLITEDNFKKINEIDAAIERLSNRIKNIQEEIDSSEDLIPIKGGGSTSYLERWQKNRKAFVEEQNRLKERTGLEMLG